jgi:hypothetical protein
MACECLEEGRKVRCNAVDGELIPSLHERERYCRADANWASCPTFQLRAREHRRIAQEEYYALWTLPEMPPIRPVLRTESKPSLQRAV